MARGVPSREARRERRALVAAASGSTSLPLSDRNAAWDAAAAKRSLSPGQFGSAHFWHDSTKPADQITSYKLPFASAAGGSLTAVWRGVTASAGAISGARGGVDIPSGDVAAVKARIGSYYTKAAKKYDDPNIKVPWAADLSDTAFAIAEKLGGSAPTSVIHAQAILLAYAETLGGEGYFVRHQQWFYALADISEEDHAMENIVDTAAATLQHTTGCECGHALSEHIGADGPCKHEDGRGVCSCGGFKEFGSEAAQQLAEGTATFVRNGDLIAFTTEDSYYEFDLSEAVPAAEFAPEDSPGGAAECADCGHTFGQHPNGGACSVQGCACSEYQEMSATAAEADDTDAVTVTASSANSATGIVKITTDGTGPFIVDTSPTPVPSPEPQPPAQLPGAEKRWKAILCPEGVPTDDGRMFAPGSISWRELPLSLMAMLETQEGHDGARVAGRIDRIWREGNYVMGEGVFDASEFGDEVARMVSDGVLRGLSVDIAIKDYKVVTPESLDAGEPEEANPVDAIFGDGVLMITDGVIGAATVCPFPAFAEAEIEMLTASGGQRARFTHQAQMTVVARVPVEALTASAAGLAPELPPVEWFENPLLDGPTAMTVTDDGRVYGHLALWDVCHIGLAGCRTAPESQSGYTYFHLGEVVCAEGERVAVGKITLGGGHADPHLGFRGAIEHYDSSGTAAAFVRVGEDDHGIWVAGAVKDDLDASQVRDLRAAPLSGDWRPINGYLELVAALAVNVPGFPVPRAEILVASIDGAEHVMALVGAGSIRSEEIVFTKAEREKIGMLVADATGELAAAEELDAVVALARSPLPDLDEAEETLAQADD